MSVSRTREPQRIAKLLARAGVASRREIERMIAEGRIAIDGKTIDTPATLLTSLRGVSVDGNPVQPAAPARLFIFHKPSGVLTTERDPAGRRTIYDVLPSDLPRLVPVGRLDLNTEGLLLMTTDGELKRELELPATGVERTYRARAYGEISQAQLEDLVEGIEIEGIRYGSIDANLERRTGANVWIEMTLTEGRNREVRRVLEYLGLEVSRLIRTRYGPFVLADLPAGEIGEVRQHDLVAFRKTLALPASKRHYEPVAARVAKPAPVATEAPEPARPRGGRRSAPGASPDHGAAKPARAARARKFREENEAVAPRSAPAAKPARGRPPRADASPLRAGPGDRDALGGRARPETRERRNFREEQDGTLSPRTQRERPSRTDQPRPLRAGPGERDQRRGPARGRGKPREGQDETLSLRPQRGHPSRTDQPSRPAREDRPRPPRDGKGRPQREGGDARPPRSGPSGGPRRPGNGPARPGGGPKRPGGAPRGPRK